MAVIETASTVLSTLAYGETSRVARLATHELGVVSVIAKGARRPRSKFGVSLHSLCSGQATIYLARHSDLHTLTAFEVTTVPEALARQVDRYAAASVLSELMIRFAPHEKNPELYGFFAHALAVLAAAPHEAVAVVALRSVWGLIKALGFAPMLDRCARDGTPVPNDGSVAFSAAHGGVLCRQCERGVDASHLSATDRANLEALIHGWGDLPALDERYQAAHRRLVGRYLRHHLSEGSALPALAMWLDESWKPLP